MRKHLSALWNNFEEYLCGGLLIAIVTLLMAQVIFRYGSGKTIAWIEEVTRFAFLYMVYLAASCVTAKNLHIRVTAHLKLLPRAAQVGLLLFTDIIWLLFCVVVVWESSVFLINMQNRPMISGALMLDMRFIYFALPFAFALQSIRLLERWWRIATGLDTIAVPSEEVF